MSPDRFFVREKNFEFDRSITLIEENVELLLFTSTTVTHDPKGDTHCFLLLAARTTANHED